MFADEVFVFSPKGDVINLPAGATPIDFAYSIHSAIGNSMVGATVNGRIVNFDYVLQNGDIVDIRTSKNAPGPSRDWLNLAKSGAARTKIKQWFKKERREENIVHGKEQFERELRANGIAPADIMGDEILPLILKRLAFTSLDDLYAAIGYGGVTATRTVNRIRDEILRNQKANQKNAIDRINEAAERRNKRPRHAVHGILVEGWTTASSNSPAAARRCRRQHHRLHHARRGRVHPPHGLRKLSRQPRQSGDRRPLDPRELGRAHHRCLQHDAHDAQRAALGPRHGRGHGAQHAQRQGAHAHRARRGQRPLDHHDHRRGARPG